jgi:hypothetical protein
LTGLSSGNSVFRELKFVFILRSGMKIVRMFIDFGEVLIGEGFFRLWGIEFF